MNTISVNSAQENRNLETIMESLEECFIQISDLIRDQDSISLESVDDVTNISGDTVKQLDLLSNTIIKEALQKCSLVRAIGSEEESELVYTENTEAPYLVCYDPLDGSSNIGVNITTGTIFGVYKYDSDGKISSGRDVVLAGYCLYGGSTQCVVANSENCSMFQLNPREKKFNCVKHDISIPNKGNIYSINESNKYDWIDARYYKVVNSFIGDKYTARWVGSLVADAHRTILKGGFFAYPGNIKNLSGKIRLLYEAYPFAFIFEKAGGVSSDGETRLLDIPFPSEKIHQKTPIILAGKSEFEKFTNL